MASAQMPLETLTTMLVASKEILFRDYKRWEWTRDLDDKQLTRLAAIVGKTLWRDYLKDNRFRRRNKLPPPKPITRQQLERFMPAQSRGHIGLVLPVDFE